MTTTVREAKRALRERVLARRRELDATALARAAGRLSDVVRGLPEVAAAGTVAAYVSVGREPGTGPLVEALSDDGVDVLLPVLLPDGDLDWARYTGPQHLAPAARGLLEPDGERLGPAAVTTAPVLLVPGLAVDRRGHRLGRGGGSYDRVLARLLAVSPPAFTCVLLHDGEVLDMPVPREPHDVPVDAAATPSRLHRLR
ncbi:5-formyltetrahydrofolate cyclo-ligase [Jiangella endophytica]|uniref:5-formyltetrahydrofolate cyclo-ligase n=1 Tax=Jiangella endophytica TaxID=1623398 RepID=UPI001E600007|nr:5-formyltetrahydrofolate cyclo-ligase [Jiangella endophytica]